MVVAAATDDATFASGPAAHPVVVGARGARRSGERREPTGERIASRPSRRPLRGGLRPAWRTRVDRRDSIRYRLVKEAPPGVPSDRGPPGTNGRPRYVSVPEGRFRHSVAASVARCRSEPRQVVGAFAINSRPSASVIVSTPVGERGDAAGVLATVRDAVIVGVALVRVQPRAVLAAVVEAVVVLVAPRLLDVQREMVRALPAIGERRRGCDPRVPAWALPASRSASPRPPVRDLRCAFMPRGTRRVRVTSTATCRAAPRHAARGSGVAGGPPPPARPRSPAPRPRSASQS